MRRTLALTIAGAALFAACSDDYDRGDAVDGLEAGGLSEASAACAADEMEERGIEFEEANEAEEGTDLFDELVGIVADCKAEHPDEESDADPDTADDNGE